MHLKERFRLSHSTNADIITTELTNRNQQEKCCTCLNLTQRAHESLFAKWFGLLSIQVLLHCMLYYDIHIIKVISAIQRFLNLPGKEITTKKGKTVP